MWLIGGLDLGVIFLAVDFLAGVVFLAGVYFFEGVYFLEVELVLVFLGVVILEMLVLVLGLELLLVILVGLLELGFPQVNLRLGALSAQLSI